MSLRSKLIKAASANPALQEHVLPLLDDSVGVGIEANTKVAVNQTTLDFCDWVFSTRAGTPMDQSEFKSAMRACSVPAKPAMSRRQGPRYQSGDMVYLKTTAGNTHYRPGQWAGAAPDGSVVPLERYFDKATAKVVSAGSGDEITVKFSDGQVVILDWGNKRRGIPLYKFIKPFTMKAGPKLEIIYLRGMKGVTDEQQLTVTNYLTRGMMKKEMRPASYYTGYPLGYRPGKNGLYLQVVPQQRYQVNPQLIGGKIGETGGIMEQVAGVRPTSMNPSIGEFLYVGKFGKRPSGWEQSFEDMKAQFVAATP